MTKLKLLSYTVIAELIGLGVFLAFLLGKAVAQGGVITLNMTYFGEMWLEYYIMLVLAALAPWAMWYITEKVE
jgi:membrane protein implicated in regulation of membrane protease activity